MSSQNVLQQNVERNYAGRNSSGQTSTRGSGGSGSGIGILEPVPIPRKSDGTENSLPQAQAPTSAVVGSGTEIGIVEPGPNAQRSPVEPNTDSGTGQSQEKTILPRPPVDSEPKRRKTPQLCCCSLREGVTTMAACDLILSMIICISMSFRVPDPTSKKFLFLLLGSIAAFLFVVLSLILVWTAGTRSKILGWTFIIFNALLFLGCVINAYVFFLEQMGGPDPFLFTVLTFTFLYKAYESVCVFYFIYETPRSYILYMDLHHGVVPVVYAPYGVYHYNYRPGYGYYDPTMAFVTGLTLGAVSHGLFW